MADKRDVLVLEERFYFNRDIYNWITSKYQTKEERAIAWMTIDFIKKRYPEIAKTLRGDLIRVKTGNLNGGLNGSNEGSN
jgi:hypothetical protein